MSAHLRVESSNPRVTSSNLFKYFLVKSSNSRSRRLKGQVSRLRARVGGLKVRVRRLKAQPKYNKTTS